MTEVERENDRKVRQELREKRSNGGLQFVIRRGRVMEKPIVGEQEKENDLHLEVGRISEQRGEVAGEGLDAMGTTGQGARPKVSSGGKNFQEEGMKRK